MQPPLLYWHDTYDTLLFLASYLKNGTMHARSTRSNLFHAVMLINWSSERDVFNCSLTDSRCILMTYSYNICKHSCCITHMQLRWPKYMVEVAKSVTMWHGGPGIARVISNHAIVHQMRHSRVYTHRALQAPMPYDECYAVLFLHPSFSWV